MKRATLLGLFRLLSQHAPSKVIAAERSQDIQTVKAIQQFLVSREVNNQYLYLACLFCLDPGVWAGTLPDQPLALEAWEVEKIMQLLDSPDDLIRNTVSLCIAYHYQFSFLLQTLMLLARIDPAIVETYLSRVLDGVSPGLDLPTLSVYAPRMLDVIAILSAEDGERYAQGTKQVLRRLDEVMDRPRVVESAVEKALVHIRACMPFHLLPALHHADTISVGSEFSVACTTTLLAYLVETTVDAGPTLLVISAALVVEYISSIPIPPPELLKAFAATLAKTTRASVSFRNTPTCC